MLSHVAFLAGLAAASLDLSWGDDSDLTDFVTRPDIKAPRFNVTTYDASRVTPGYWFTAPYAYIAQQSHAARYYQACQTGPAIYDASGQLVWSGACLMRNQNTCDFRAWTFNNTLYTSAIVYGSKHHQDPKGHGVIMDSSYRVIRNLTVPSTQTIWNMHDLALADEGRKALYMTWKERYVDVAELKMDGVDSGWIGDIGFNEVDLTNDNVTREWWAADSGRITINESRAPITNLRGPWPRVWDFIHANSIDQNAEGDYIFSARYTDTIYKISGRTGEILWRLGGDNTSFAQDFNFSRQHDARTLSITDEEEIISFLDNASDEHSQSANHSAALIVRLSRSDMTAKVVVRISRPDGQLTRLRGNHQVLENGNHFVCWSENSYISEHSPSGDLLFEAQFASQRFVTYRAYKFNYTGVPDEPPAIFSQVVGNAANKSITVVHVSWNGATEVSKWRFHSIHTGKIADSTSVYIGEKVKSGFETALYYEGYAENVYAEAIDENGDVIGTSPVFSTKIPAEWVSNFENRPAPAENEATDDRARISNTWSPQSDTAPSSPLSYGAYTVILVELLLLVVVGYSCMAYCRACRSKRVAMRQSRWKSALEDGQDLCCSTVSLLDEKLAR